MYIEIEKAWPGETVYILAGGASVRDLDLSRLRGKKVIAVNTAVFTWPLCQVMYWNDPEWYRQWGEKLAGYRGRVITGCAHLSMKIYDQVKKAPAKKGLAVDPGRVAMSYTSTQAAMNIAYHYGARRLVLLGVDCKLAADGTRNHHSPHRHKSRVGWAERWIGDFEHVARVAPTLGVEILNASPDTDLTCFEKVSFEKVCL